MVKARRITIPIIHVPIIYCVDCQKEDAAKAFYNYNGERSVFEPSCNADGGVQAINGYIFLWVEGETKQKASVLIHEMVHICCTALDMVGIERDEELIAYLMEWLKINLMDKIHYR
jgi:hypothetical protein